MVVDCVTGLPPLLIVAVTVHPAVLRPFEDQFSGATSLITASGPALHSVFSSPAPFACIASEFVSSAQLQLSNVRPSSCA